MMSELNDDMEEAEQTMSSTQTFRTEGVMKMSAMSEQHYQQRSHAIPSANRAAPSSYANLQKKSMMQSAKAAFGIGAAMPERRGYDSIRACDRRRANDRGSSRRPARRCCCRTTSCRRSTAG